MTNFTTNQQVLQEQINDLAELAGGFIHDIKNYISTFQLNLQLIAEEFENPQNHKDRRALERINKLQNECGKLVDLSNDFLRFARLQELHCRPCKLNDLIVDMINFFQPTAKQSGIEIRFYPMENSSVIQADEDLIKQSILNLILNAEQAIPNGGEITLATRAEGDMIALDVIDTGIGISPDNLETIFRPFHSTKPGGTGLGLPTTKKIIQAHGGSISVQSEVGHGTKFTLLLPASSEGHPQAKDSSEVFLKS